MTRITTLDLPHFGRTAVGFDRLFTEIERNFTNSQTNNYPPYNIVEIDQDAWMISIAVAGFGMDNLDITLDSNILIVEGIQTESENTTYLHKGIGARKFRRQFTLADHIEVQNASLDLGMLNIHLKRNIPEELQPKKIVINSAPGFTLTLDQE